MTTESEIRRENLQLREEKSMLLELRQENRELKRQIERLQKGKSPESSVKKFFKNYGTETAFGAFVILCALVTMYTLATISV